ncbi:hypothetical protein GT347_19490 [Xylophilus rhododendri]|uniref:Uncharacterized protein n=1 Tax=Xylophilus rhododendri TaxID=2697032 RepID=A0A857JAA8_9BURK|nr:hypothetical protein GT347_19490 [Xylophilus rhododendri]
MKFIVSMLLLALCASAVSAASVFLDSEAARVTPESGISVPALLIAGIGMMLTVVWRCNMAR